MRITNVLKLPQPFVDAVSREYQYVPKRYSVTTILKDNKEIILSRRHHNEIESDVSDMVWAIFGSAVHKILEEANKQQHLLTEYKMIVPIMHGYELSGICDLFDTVNHEVVDYKTVSTFKCLKGDFEDFRKQGLAYCWMLNKLNFVANKATFWMILRDWQNSKAKFDSQYPNHQVQKVTFDYTEQDFNEFTLWVQEKFDSLITDEAKDDKDIPICSPEARWHTDDTYAVMKNNRKSALRLFNSREEAERYMAEKGGDYIDVRYGCDRKCEDYCSCCKWCENLKGDE